MGAIAFSIKNGIQMKCHSLINPGKLPLGHAFAAKSHSERTHKLPPPPNAKGDEDYVIIINLLTEFLTQLKNSNDKVFLLLVMEQEQEMVENLLTQLCDAAEISTEKYVVLPLIYFFEKLRQYCEAYYRYKPNFPFTYAAAISHLERDIFDYIPGNGCEYHEKDEINIHCALSRVTRYAYIILEHTMDICEVESKKPTFHFPAGYFIKGTENNEFKEQTNLTLTHQSEENNNKQSDEESTYTISKIESSKKPFAQGRVKDEYDDMSSTVTATTTGLSFDVSTLEDSVDNLTLDNDKGYVSTLFSNKGPSGSDRTGAYQKVTAGRIVKPASRISTDSTSSIAPSSFITPSLKDSMNNLTFTEDSKIFKNFEVKVEVHRNPFSKEFSNRTGAYPKVKANEKVKPDPKTSYDQDYPLLSSSSNRK